MSELCILCMDSLTDTYKPCHQCKNSLYHSACFEKLEEMDPLRCPTCRCNLMPRLPHINTYNAQTLIYINSARRAILTYALAKNKHSMHWLQCVMCMRELQTRQLTSEHRQLIHELTGQFDIVQRYIMGLPALKAYIYTVLLITVYGQILTIPYLNNPLLSWINNIVSVVYVSANLCEIYIDNWYGFIKNINAGLLILCNIISIVYFLSLQQRQIFIYHSAAFILLAFNGTLVITYIIYHEKGGQWTAREIGLLK